MRTNPPMHRTASIQHSPPCPLRKNVVCLRSFMSNQPPAILSWNRLWEKILGSYRRHRRPYRLGYATVGALREARCFLSALW